MTHEKLFQSVWTRNPSFTKEDFNKRLKLMSKILIDDFNCCKILFHHSFAEWLLDVKHCTQKYLCHASDGHGMISMRYTMIAETLDPDQVCDFALHMSKLNLAEPFNASYLPLWLIMCGTPVETSLSKLTSCEQKTLNLLLNAGAHAGTCNKDRSSVEVNEDDPIDTLIKSGSDINYIDNNQRTLLHCAAYEANTQLVEALIKRGADLEIIERNGQTALNLGSFIISLFQACFVCE